MISGGRREGLTQRLARDIEATVQAVTALPGLIPALQRLAPAVERIAELGPALEQLADLGPTLDGLARLSETLERLAGLRETLDALVRVVEPITVLPALIPTLESLDNAGSSLEVTIGSVSETLAPLQSTTQRVGRVVDRLGKPRSKAGPRLEAGEPS